MEYSNIIYTGRAEDQRGPRKIVRKSRTAFGAEPLESVNWGRGTEDIVEKRQNVKCSAMWGTAQKTKVMIRGIEPAEGKWKMNLQHIPIIYRISQGHEYDPKSLICSLNFKL